MAAGKKEREGEEARGSDRLSSVQVLVARQFYREVFQFSRLVDYSR